MSLDDSYSSYKQDAKKPKLDRNKNRNILEKSK
nr:MAG TPA: hypothetical protein [Caudoviricetes sp.]